MTKKIRLLRILIFVHFSFFITKATGSTDEITGSN